MSKEDAEKKVKDLGLKFEVVDTEASDQPKDTVLFTSPEAGTSVKTGDFVRARISSGPKMAEVPNVKELDLASAKSMIQNSGFTVGKVDSQNSDSIPKDSIIDQSPQPGGDDLAQGKAIDLVVSLGPKIPMATVPDLTGFTLDQADGALKSRNLVLGDKTQIQTTDTSLIGKIKDQSVAKDTSIPQGQKVNVSYYVAPPKAQKTLPKDYKGLTVGIAQQDLLTLSNKFKISANGNANDIVSEVKQVDKVLKAGDVVDEDAALTIISSPAPTTTQTP
jgi:serine/threonine-protein kinase